MKTAIEKIGHFARMFFDIDVEIKESTTLSSLRIEGAYRDDLRIHLEQSFGTTIGDEAAEGWETVADVVMTVERAARVGRQRSRRTTDSLIRTGPVQRAGMAG